MSFVSVGGNFGRVFVVMMMRFCCVFFFKNDEDLDVNDALDKVPAKEPLFIRQSGDAMRLKSVMIFLRSSSLYKSI